MTHDDLINLARKISDLDRAAKRASGTRRMSHGGRCYGSRRDDLLGRAARLEARFFATARQLGIPGF